MPCLLFDILSHIRRRMKAVTRKDKEHTHQSATRLEKAQTVHHKAVIGKHETRESKGMRSQYKNDAQPLEHIEHTDEVLFDFHLSFPLQSAVKRFEFTFFYEMHKPYLVQFRQIQPCGA